MKIVIYGSGKMAELTCYYFTNDSEYEVVAFCVDDAYVPAKNSSLLGLPLLGFKQVVDKYPKESHKIHVAIGRNSAREITCKKVSENGYSFANYVSSKASVWPDLVIGQNTFIDQCCDIHPFVTIGDNCMLMGTRLGHHSIIKNNVLISGSTLAGNVTVGNNTFLGINSAVKEDVCIGSHNIIGASVFINKDTEDYAIISNSTVPKRIGDSKRFMMFSKPSEIKEMKG